MENDIKLIVGLGNPGEKYVFTRHNLGFLTVDAFLEKESPRWQKKFDGEFTKLEISGKEYVFLKPQSFMNCSGEPIRSFLHFYKFRPSQMLVIHDEADLEEGDVRLKKGGGAGGHNGLLSIFETLGEQDFYRIRVGVGKSDKKELADYLLEKSSKNKLLALANQACHTLQAVFDHGFVKAQNLQNRGQAVSDT